MNSVISLTASSSTKKRQHDSANFPVDIRSSRRPGVPTTMSTWSVKTMIIDSDRNRETIGLITKRCMQKSHSMIVSVFSLQPVQNKLPVILNNKLFTLSNLWKMLINHSQRCKPADQWSCNTHLRPKPDLNIAVFSEKTDVPHLPNQSMEAISVMKLWPWKLGQRHQNWISYWSCLIYIGLQIW